MATSELDPKKNKDYRLHREFSQQTKLVIIATVAAIVASLALLMSWMAANNAMEAKIRAEYQDEKIAVLTEELAVAQIYTRDLKAYMIEQGFKPPEEE